MFYSTSYYDIFDLECVIVNFTANMLQAQVDRSALCSAAVCSLVNSSHFPFLFYSIYQD